MKKILSILILLFAANVFAQNNDPQKLINRVRDKFKKVQDYEVDAQIKVDIDFVKVPDMKAKIYFKQPDKVKMNTEGFAMIPKQAFNFSPEKLFKDSYNALFVKTEKFNNTNVSVIKIIPTDEKSDVAISTLWIDTNNDVLRKIETTGKKGGSFQVEMNYSNNPAYPLPSFIKFSFDLPKVNMPRNMRDGNQSDMNDNKTDKQRPDKGTVNISYSNYKINKGIPDSFFAEKKDNAAKNNGRK